MNRFCCWLIILTGLGAAPCARAGFSPLRYFEGKSTSQGALRVLGKSRAFTTLARGRHAGASLYLRQHFRFADGREQDRLWTLFPYGSEQIAGRANDSVGRPQGEVKGQTFHFRYQLQAVPGNRFSVLSFEQWMTLQPDGRTMENHGVIRKFGIRIGSLHEVFRK